MDTWNSNLLWASVILRAGGDKLLRDECRVSGHVYVDSKDLQPESIGIVLHNHVITSDGTAWRVAKACFYFGVSLLRLRTLLVMYDLRFSVCNSDPHLDLGLPSIRLCTSFLLVLLVILLLVVILRTHLLLLLHLPVLQPLIATEGVQWTSLSM